MNSHDFAVRCVRNRTKSLEIQAPGLATWIADARPSCPGTSGSLNMPSARQTRQTLKLRREEWREKP